MSGADFFDTNVLVYSVDSGNPEKRDTAANLIAGAIGRGSGMVSFQVVQESLHVVGRKFKVALDDADVTHFLHHTLQPMWKVQPTVGLYERALALQSRWHFAFYDSLIVAAALEGGCKRLLSEDLQHGQKIESLRIENPFRT